MSLSHNLSHFSPAILNSYSIHSFLGCNSLFLYFFTFFFSTFFPIPMLSWDDCLATWPDHMSHVCRWGSVPSVKTAVLKRPVPEFWHDVKIRRTEIWSAFSRVVAECQLHTNKIIQFLEEMRGVRRKRGGGDFLEEEEEKKCGFNWF